MRDIAGFPGGLSGFYADKNIAIQLETARDLALAAPPLTPVATHYNHAIVAVAAHVINSSGRKPLRRA